MIANFRTTMGFSRRRPGRRTGSRFAVLSTASLSVLLVAPGATVAQETGDPDVRDLLGRAEAIYDGLSSMRARFDQTIEITLLGRKRTGSGDWYQKGAGRFKMDFTDPEGDVIVSDGVTLWLYYPSTHPGQVIRSTIDANATGAGMVDLQGRIFEEAAEAYDAMLEGRRDVEGHETWLVTLTPRAESPYRKVRVWIDTGTLLVRRFEITEENETLRTVVLRDLQPDAPIEDAVFRFTPPAGTDVFAG